MTLKGTTRLLKNYGRFWDWHLFRWQFWLVCGGLVLVMKVALGSLFGPTYLLFWWRRTAPPSSNAWVWLVADGLAMATVYALIGGAAARLSISWRNRQSKR